MKLGLIIQLSSAGHVTPTVGYGRCSTPEAPPFSSFAEPANDGMLTEILGRGGYTPCTQDVPDAGELLEVTRGEVMRLTLGCDHDLRIQSSVS